MITVQEETLRDVNCALSTGEVASWISIKPRYPDGYIVYWREPDERGENFKKNVATSAELKALLGSLISLHQKGVDAAKRVQRQSLKVANKEELAATLALVRQLKKEGAQL